MPALPEAAELLRRLRQRLLYPPPPTPEAEAAALLLYAGLPARAIFGKAENEGSGSGWVWWVWGSYPSKRALLPDALAARLEELRDLLRERHKSESALLRSLQMQMAKHKPVRWRAVRDLWDIYLGQGGPATRLLQLKRELELLP